MARPPLFILALVLISCAQPSPGASAGASSEVTNPPSSAPQASSSAPVSSAPPAAPTAPDPPAANLTPPGRETERRLWKALREDKLLAAHEAIVAQHLDAGVPSPLETQTVTLPGDRRAVLAYAPTPPMKPFLFVAAPDGSVVWSKERPLAGTRQIVTQMVLTPGPAGELAMLWCDIPTQIVALRRWAPDGVPLADFQVMEVDLCDAVTGLYWPGRGWLVVASQQGGARMQLFDERGARSFAPKGIELPWTARPSAPAALALDSDDSVMVLQVGERPKAGAFIPDRLLAMRYDAQGTPLWDAPIDLGTVDAAKPSAHVAVVGEPGKVHVTLSTRGPVANRVTLSSAGRIEVERGR